MTVCNMSIEAGARAGMIAPDDTTFEYLAGPAARAARARPGTRPWPRWRSLPTDDGARFDREVTLDAGTLEPMITYGTNPGMGVPDQRRGARSAPDDRERDRARRSATWASRRASRSLGQPIDVVFIGSCTNSRISDLRLAAAVLQGPQGRARACRCWWCPARSRSRGRPRAEGLDRIFREAGAEWREAGCSMCIAMNGDQLAPGQYCVSTSNRNFEGRQGAGGRTFLASPLTAAGVRRSPAADRRRPGRAAPMSEPFGSFASQTGGRCLRRTSTPTRSSRRGSSKTTSSEGLGKQLFADWRYDADGKPEARLRPEPAPKRRAHGPGGRRATSAAAARASTRCGRCGLRHSAP